jgi:hypothetical protein
MADLAQNVYLMKKLKLNFSNLKDAEILTREDLKKVMGGDAGSGSGTCSSLTSSQCTSSTACKANCNGVLTSGNCTWSTAFSKCYCSVVC